MSGIKCPYRDAASTNLKLKVQKRRQKFSLVDDYVNLPSTKQV